MRTDAIIDLSQKIRKKRKRKKRYVIPLKYQSVFSFKLLFLSLMKCSLNFKELHFETRN